jgi:hypothetical protein
MGKKEKRRWTPRYLTTSRDINRWLDRAAQQLIASDYDGVIATAQRVLRAPIASREQPSTTRSSSSPSTRSAPTMCSVGTTGRGPRKPA